MYKVSLVFYNSGHIHDFDINVSTAVIQFVLAKPSLNGDLGPKCPHGYPVGHTII